MTRRDLPLGMRLRLLAFRVLATETLRARVERIGAALVNTGKQRFRNDPKCNGEALLQDAALALCSSEPEILVFDVGANVGSWSARLLSAAEEQGLQTRLRLIALEPTAQAFADLTRSLAPFSGSRVELRRVAASDREGEAEMSIYGPASGTNSLEPRHAGGDKHFIQSETVATARLADLVDQAEVDDVHLLKIDAEGHDSVALRGALELFQERRVWIAQFEYNSRWIPGRHLLIDVYELLSGLGYTLGFLSPLGIVWRPVWDASLEDFYESNFVIVRDDLRPMLPSMD